MFERWREREKKKRDESKILKITPLSASSLPKNVAVHLNLIDR
jgi:hypothetical protein